MFYFKACAVLLFINVLFKCLHHYLTYSLDADYMYIVNNSRTVLIYKMLNSQ